MPRRQGNLLHRQAQPTKLPVKFDVLLRNLGRCPFLPVKTRQRLGSLPATNVSPC